MPKSPKMSPSHSSSTPTPTQTPTPSKSHPTITNQNPNPNPTSKNQNQNPTQNPKRYKWKPEEITKYLSWMEKNREIVNKNKKTPSILAKMLKETVFPNESHINLYRLGKKFSTFKDSYNRAKDKQICFYGYGNGNGNGNGSVDVDVGVGVGVTGMYYQFLFSVIFFMILIIGGIILYFFFFFFFCS